MDASLWAETHAPGLDDPSQLETCDRLRCAVDEPMNLVVQGLPGVGKITTVCVPAREVHADPENDPIGLNVADFFNRTRKQIRADPRLGQFLGGRSRMAKYDMINRVLKESAGHAPTSGEYKIIVLDNTESIHEDFQQALRRVMEQYHRTTQFVIITRQPSEPIPPIYSRCFPVLTSTPDGEVLEVLPADVLDTEGVDYDAGGLQFLTDASNGNVRKVMLSVQRTATEIDGIIMSTVHAALDDMGFDDELETFLINIREDDIKDARKILTMLLDDEGYEGQELLVDILRVVDSTPERFVDSELARLHELAGQVDLDISTGIDDCLHIAHLPTSWGADAHGET